MDPKDWAKSIISDFRGRNKAGMWVRLQCAQVADELAARVEEPKLINQNNTIFCAYAALAYNTAKRSPQQYAWCAVGLFEDAVGYFGVYGGKKAKLEPSDSLRKSALPRFQSGSDPVMPQADWMMLSSMREHFNGALWDVGEGIPILSPIIKEIHGGTTSGQVIDALKELGCTECYDQSTTHSTRGLDFALAASGHFDQGRLVVLFIESDMITDKYGTDPGIFSQGDHWVGLNSPITLSADKQTISFQVFSWGRLIDISIPVVSFLRRFYGYVAGKF
jgi:hypothetical protein